MGSIQISKHFITLLSDLGIMPIAFTLTKKLLFLTLQSKKEDKALNHTVKEPYMLHLTDSDKQNRAKLKSVQIHQKKMNSFKSQKNQKENP